MNFAEQLTAINAEYWATRKRARQHPVARMTYVRKGRKWVPVVECWGVNRDRVERKATRDRKQALIKLGLNSARI